MIEIIPTNTCPPDLSELESRSELFSAFAPHVQLDVADGNFVPAKSWPYFEAQKSELEALAGGPKNLPLSGRVGYEIHIMADAPSEIGTLMARAGAVRILGHVEAFSGTQEAEEALTAWRSAGAAEAGIAVLLDTPLSFITALVPHADVVQLMSIAKLGYQGAPFEPSIFSRISELHAAHPQLVIEIDGGVSEKNIEELVRAGATRFGVGSAISKADNPKAAYEHLKMLAESAIQ